MALLLSIMLSSVVVDVSLSDGQQVSGEFVSLSNESLTLISAVGTPNKVTFTRDGLTRARFPAHDVVEASPVFVQFTDDSVVPCDAVLLTDGKLQVTNGAASWNAPEATVRAIRWPQPNEKTDDQWNEILGKSETDDLLVIRRDNNLDYLKGVVLQVSKDAIQFEYSGSTIPFPLAKAAGFILARQNKDRPTPRMQLTTHDGGKWILRSAIAKTDQVDLISMDGVQRVISIEDVSEIQFPQSGAVYLSELEPTSVDFESFVGSQLDETIRQLNAPQFDRSADGLMLRLDDASSATGWQQFRRGVSIQSRTQLVYRLAGAYQRFQATAGIDPTAPSQADVELRLFADEREIYNRSVRKSDPPILVDVDVRGARRLRIFVDYGNNIDIGDRLHLGDARLTK